MSTRKHLTEYICICQQCDQETMIIEEGGDLSVACPKCHHCRKVQRPDGKLTTSVLDSLFNVQFRTYNRPSNKTLKD